MQCSDNHVRLVELGSPGRLYNTVTQGCKLQHTKLKVGIEISDGKGGGMAGNVLLKSCTISCKTQLSVMSSEAPPPLVARCVLHFFPLLL